MKVFREVRLHASDGRLFWRPNSAGYTTTLADAGLYDAGTWTNTEHSVEVGAAPLLRVELNAARDRLARLERMWREAMRPDVCNPEDFGPHAHRGPWERVKGSDGASRCAACGLVSGK